MWNAAYKCFIFSYAFFADFEKIHTNCGNLKCKLLIFRDVKISQNSSFWLLSIS